MAKGKILTAIETAPGPEASQPTPQPVASPPQPTLEHAKPGETKAEAFVRLGDKRVTKALQAIRIIGNLAGSAYDYTDEQVKLIEDVLMQALAETITRFNPKSAKDTPSFTLSTSPK